MISKETLKDVEGQLGGDTKENSKMLAIVIVSISIILVVLVAGIVTAGVIKKRKNKS